MQRAWDTTGDIIAKTMATAFAMAVTRTATIGAITIATDTAGTSAVIKQLADLLLNLPQGLIPARMLFSSAINAFGAFA